MCSSDLYAVALVLVLVGCSSSEEQLALSCDQGSATDCFQLGSVLAAPGRDPAAARARFRDRIEASGHAVDNARAAMRDLEADLAAGVLERTPMLALCLADLGRALEQDEGRRLGGKSAEAARRILLAVSRELDNA